MACCLKFIVQLFGLLGPLAMNKFQMPETWLLQVARMSGASWPGHPDTFNMTSNQNLHLCEGACRICTNHLAKQPNGFPDTEAEWLSPEYLVRRLSLINNAKRFGLRPNDLDMPAFIDSVINRNFDAPKELYEFVTGLGDDTSPSNQLVALFCSERMLKV